jgi:peptidoglycan/LPS O-acetylase OafA/YrhL
MGIPGSSDPATAGRPFFTRVESLRGLGALAVAGYHMTGAVLHGRALFPHLPWPGVGESQNALGRFALACLPGHAALMLFFVISGFVLRVALEHGPQTVPAAAAKFFLARLFRIYPIVIVSLVVLVLLLGGPVTLDGHAAPAPAPSLVLANAMLLDVSLRTELWALQLELLMAPVILALYFLERRSGPRLLVGLALLTTVLSFTRSWAGWPPLSGNAFAFVLGMLVPTLGRDAALGLSRRATTAWAVAAVVALVLPGPLLGVFSRFSSVIEAYAAVVLVSLVAYRVDLRAFRFLDAWALRLLGRSSGSYYVLHMLTMPAALAVAAAVIPSSWSETAPAAVGVVVVAVWLVAIAPLMVCGFYLVESPGIALGRRMIGGLGLERRRPTSPPVPAPLPDRRAA